MYKLLACAFLFFVVSSSGAAENSGGRVIGVHMLSIHDKSGFNTVTPGVYYKSQNGLTAGILNNSESRVGMYVGKTFESDEKVFGLTVGAITGYSATVTPIIVPSLYVRPVGIRLSWLSKPPNTKGASALHISYERDF